VKRVRVWPYLLRYVGWRGGLVIGCGPSLDTRKGSRVQYGTELVSPLRRVPHGALTNHLEYLKGPGAV
jgi:hypothetical protein